jgi:FG-GAP-like repeat
MKTRVSPGAVLLLVVIGCFQALSQTPSSVQQVVSKSSQHNRGLSQSGRALFSNRDGSWRRQLRARPNAGSPPPTASFLSAIQMESDGDAIYPVASGDFSGDKLSDVVTVIHNTGSPTGTYLAVLLQVAGQSLAIPVLTPVSFGPNDLILVADVNKDGKDDVVLVHSNSIDVLISAGDGTFVAPLSLATGIGSPVAASFWDVNHDKALDVVVVDGSSHQAAFLLGNGQGSFAGPQMKSFPGQVSIGVLADVDLDGNLDLVTNNTLYPGDGQGGFLTGISFQSSDGQNAGAVSSNSVAVGDLNGDGFLDVVTANGNSNTVSVFRNQGGRTLVQVGSSLWSGNNPVALAIADVNWDGKADLIVSNAAESDFSVFLGKGDGTFLAPTAQNAIGGAPSARPVLADVNGDGDLDVVLSDNQSSVVVAQGYGDGTFQAVQDTNIVVPAGTSNSGGAISIASADFNGDGVADFVVGQSSTSPGLGLVVFMGKNGSLGTGVHYAQNTALSYVAVGDFNKDGKTDIVASNWATGAVEVLRGNGDGTFQSPTSITLPGISNGLVVADFNGDGWPDVAVAGKDPVVYILLNNGSGSLSLAGTYPISGAGFKLVAADVNGDGKLDLCVAMTSTTSVAVLLGNGNGTFSAAPDYDTFMPTPYGIAAGDLNGDGFVDLVVTSPATGSISMAFGNGDGTFNQAGIYSASILPSMLNPSPGEVTLSDVNEDGTLDIVYANSGYGSVGVYLTSSSGNFYGPYEYPAGGGALAVATADVNKDGWPDIVTADVNFSGVSVVYNISGQQPTPDFTVSANPTAVRASSGGTVTSTISLSSMNAFYGAVQLSCQNLPKALSCAFAPSTVHLVKGKVLSSKLTITASKSNSQALASGQGLLGLAIIPLLGGMFFWRIPRAANKTAILALLASLLLFSGCQGLAPSKGGSQTYTVTVLATGWSGTSHSVPVQVTVQD